MRAVAALWTCLLAASPAFAGRVHPEPPLDPLSVEFDIDAIRSAGAGFWYRGRDGLELALRALGFKIVRLAEDVRLVPRGTGRASVKAIIERFAAEERLELTWLEGGAGVVLWRRSSAEEKDSISRGLLSAVPGEKAAAIWNAAYSEDLELFERALARAGEDADAALELAYALARSHRWDEALAIGRRLAVGVLAAAIERGEPGLRADAALAAPLAGGEEARAFLTKTFADESSTVRAAAVRGLSAVDAAWAHALIKSAAADPAGHVRQAALYLLAETSFPRAETIRLAEEALGDPDEEAREAALDCLVRCRAPSAVEHVERRVREEAEADKIAELPFRDLPPKDRARLVSMAMERATGRGRYEILNSLARTSGPELIPILERALDDQDPQVAAAAAGACPHYGGTIAASLIDKAIARGGHAVLEELAAGAALGGSRETLRKLLPRLVASTAPRGASLLVWHLSIPHTAEAEEAIEALLQSADAGVRIEAAEALLKRGSRKGLDALRKALTDESDQLRAEAVEALVRWGKDEAFAALEEAMGSADEKVRTSVASKLGNASGKRRLALAERAARDPSPAVRSALAGSLAGDTDEAELGLLDKLLADPSPDVRAKAIGHLPSSERRWSTERLVRALSDPEEKVRVAAAAGAGMSLRTGAAEFAERCLAHEDVAVRMHAINSLQWHGPAELSLGLLVGRIGAETDQGVLARMLSMLEQRFAGEPRAQAAVEAIRAKLGRAGVGSNAPQVPPGGLDRRDRF